MADSDQEKTEAATERQVERFREQGRVAESRELVAAVSLVGGVLAILGAIPLLLDGTLAVLRFTRDRMIEPELTAASLVALEAILARSLGPPLLLILAGSAAASTVTGLALTGLNIAPAALEPKWERLDVLSSAKQMYLSKDPWIALGKSLLIAALLGWATWGCIQAHLDALPPLAGASLDAQLRFATDLAQDFAKRVLPIALAVGAADYLWQRWKHAESMKMGKQEVKEEHKDQEGDPHVRARRRARQRQIATGNALARVREAQVVITNPTHYAIALAYRREEHAAPIVVARGVDHLALRIRAEATRHQIPLVENRPLARALYAKARPGRPIPAEFYGPVAQVLAIVFRQRRRSPPPRVEPPRAPLPPPPAD